MKHLARLHRADSQTAPEIYASHRVFQLGAGEDRARYHQWGFNITLGGECTYWNESDGDFSVLTGDILFSRPYTNSSWRVGPRKSAAKRTGKQAHREPGWETAYAVFYPRPHWLTWLDSWTYRGGFARLHHEGAAWSRIVEAVLAMTRTYHSGGPLRDELTLALFEIVILRIFACNEPRISRDNRIRDAVELMQLRGLGCFSHADGFPNESQDNYTISQDHTSLGILGSGYTHIKNTVSRYVKISQAEPL